MSNVKEQIDSLLSREMDRRNFLKYGGTILLGVLGITGLLRLILTKDAASSVLDADQNKKSAGGYGASPYGK